jgi:hypothetical protein
MSPSKEIMRYQITGTTRNPNNTIKQLYANGRGWIDKSQVVYEIDNSINQFYTVIPNTGKEVPVKVVRNINEAWVESKPDGIISDNLYSLPVY